MNSIQPESLFFLAAVGDPRPALLPIQILAAIALMVVIGAFVYVLRHLRKIEQTILSDKLLPAQRGPRNNVVLIICAIPIVIVALLLFLVIKA